MQITIDPEAGFCFGVKRAINMAEQAAKEGPLASLGEIVHNHEEVERLRQTGIQPISHEELSRTSEKRVLLRAHGEPPSTYEKASACGLELIDATCPVVAGIQKKVRKVYREILPAKGQIVIFGKRNHPEIIGLLGQTDGSAILVESEKDFGLIDFKRPIHLFTQSTMQPARFEALIASLRQQSLLSGSNPDAMLIIYNTICRHVSGREKNLRNFARQHDVIVFVSGSNSSNGKYLFSCCREENPRSYFISSAGELQPSWLSGAVSVGISGATSTPAWLMEQVKQRLQEIIIN